MSHFSAARIAPMGTTMAVQLARTAPRSTPALRPSKVAVWPIDDRRYGLDLTYHGPTGYADAESAQGFFAGRGVTAGFRQELDGSWSVRLGPVPSSDVRSLLDLFIAA